MCIREFVRSRIFVLKVNFLSGLYYGIREMRIIRSYVCVCILFLDNYKDDGGYDYIVDV